MESAASQRYLPGKRTGTQSGLPVHRPGFSVCQHAPNAQETEPIVTKVYEEADRTMEPLLGKTLSSCIYLDESDEAALAVAENGLKQTAITQPAVLATETALARLLGAYGIVPDMVMGHSLGEYGALVAAGAISFEEALKAVSARGNEMTRCALDDNGMMAAVFGPIDKIEQILSTRRRLCGHRQYQQQQGSRDWRNDSGR